jgi:hypothetical protein
MRVYGCVRVCVCMDACICACRCVCVYTFSTLQLTHVREVTLIDTSRSADMVYSGCLP